MFKLWFKTNFFKNLFQNNSNDDRDSPDQLDLDRSPSVQPIVEFHEHGSGSGSAPKRPKVEVVDNESGNQSYNSYFSKSSANQSYNSYYSKPVDDEFEIFGNHVASQLTKLPTSFRLLAQEEIQTSLTKYRISALSNQESLNNPSCSSPNLSTPDFTK